MWWLHNYHYIRGFQNYKGQGIWYGGYQQIPIMHDKVIAYCLVWFSHLFYLQVLECGGNLHDALSLAVKAALYDTRCCFMNHTHHCGVIQTSFFLLLSWISIHIHLTLKSWHCKQWSEHNLLCDINSSHTKNTIFKLLLVCHICSSYYVWFVQDSMWWWCTVVEYIINLVINLFPCLIESQM